MSSPADGDAQLRISRALIRRVEMVETFPLSALAAQTELHACLSGLEAEAVKKARNLGASWRDIADALGVTRQAVQQRYGGDKDRAP